MKKLYNGMNQCGKIFAFGFLLLWLITLLWGIIALVIHNDLMTPPVYINALLTALGGIMGFVWRMRVVPPEEEMTKVTPAWPSFLKGKENLNALGFLSYELFFCGFTYMIIIFSVSFSIVFY